MFNNVKPDQYMMYMLTFGILVIAVIAALVIPNYLRFKKDSNEHISTSKSVMNEQKDGNVQTHEKHVESISQQNASLESSEIQSSNTKDEVIITDELRMKILTATPDSLGIDIDTMGTEVWGVVMEEGFSEGHFTLVSLADGTTSIYFSSGGGRIGGGFHESVKEETLKFIEIANEVSHYGIDGDEFPTPLNEEVCFYFLVNEGVRMARFDKDALVQRNHDFHELYLQGHSVITQIRLFDEM